MNAVQGVGEFGIQVGNVNFDWSRILARKRRIVEDLSAHKAENLEARGIRLFPQRARFLTPNEVEVDGQRVRAEKIILCLGARPRELPVPGVEKAITSNEALDLPSVPRSLVMIGGGYIAMEFCHVFRSFGCQITILEIGDRILDEFDPDISAALTDICNRKRMEIHTSAQVTRVDGERGNLTVTALTRQGEQQFSTEMVMLAVGRAPNVDGVDIEKAGVKYTKRGIEVDDELRTSAPHIYAAGDVIGRIQLTPVASMEGRIAAHNALTDQPIRPDYRLVTSAVFTVAEAAAVGLTEEQARKQGHEVQVVRYPFAELGSAMAVGETEGFVKTVFDARTRRVLGVHIVGAEASELIHLGAMAMKAGWTPDDLQDLIMIHPSLAEGFLASATSMRTGHPEGCCG